MVSMPGFAVSSLAWVVESGRVPLPLSAALVTVNVLACAGERTPAVTAMITEKARGRRRTRVPRIGETMQPNVRAVCAGRKVDQGADGTCATASAGGHARRKGS